MISEPDAHASSPEHHPSLVDAHAAAQRRGRMLIVCDVSPPRGAVIDTLPAIAAIPADFFCVAYSPGQTVRLD